jgi:lipopolysaccharide/colanic/teichoic acid biosynthesis glycosyltransferase
MNKACKRAIDVILGLIGLIVAGPVLALISLLVWLDSPGKVIFGQERLGLHGKRFRMLKFRKFPAHWVDEGPGVTTRNDPRMGKVGAILERTKLDELPQLCNILKGEMSFVGPRPESTRFADLFGGKYADLLNYIPGLFGPSQIIFRNENERYVADEDPDSYYRRVLFPQKAEIDLAYFRESNCLKDIIFIIKGAVSTLIGLVNWKWFLHQHGKVLILDTLLIATAWGMANILRFGGVPPQEHFEIMIKGFFIVPPLLLVGMIASGCYKCPVKYFSLHSAVILTFVIAISCLLSFLLLVKLYRDISLYLAPMEIIIVLALLASPRVLTRIRWEKSLAERSDGTQRILIYGAGRTGLGLASCFSNGNLLGFVDDDPDLRGARIRGFKVFGYESDISTIHKVHPFENLWVTFSPATDKRLRLEKLCECNNIKLLILPELEPFTTLKTCQY